jgi:hypothetical protein
MAARSAQQKENTVAEIRPEFWIAIYAAILSTGGLFLGIRRWFEAGPRLRVAIIPDGMTIGGDSQFDEQDIIAVTVTNRGEASTMITGLLLFEIETWGQRLRRKSKRSFLIPNPHLKGYPPNIPHVLEPGRFWMGAIRQRQDIAPDLQTGTFYIGLSTTHCDRPYLRRIPKRKKKDKLIIAQEDTKKGGLP